MATTELPEPGEPTFTIVERTVQRVEQATGTGDRLTLRALVGLVLVAPACVLAPIPVNVIAAVGLVVLAIEVARLAWHK
jgi:hypothetical protein